MSTPHDSTEDKSFLKTLWNVAFIIFYPIITLFSLIFTGIIFVFSALSRLLTKFSNEEEVATTKKPVWEKFTEAGKYKLDTLFIEEIMFGPAYYQLRSRPNAPELLQYYFGDFKYPCFNGVLLQKWNTTVPKDLPNFELMYFNGETGVLQSVAQINAFTWQVVPKDDAVEIAWLTGTESNSLLVTKEKLLEKEKGLPH